MRDRMGDREPAANENPSIPAGFGGELGGYHIRPHPDLPFEDREPGLAGYQPDLGGAIQGSDACDAGHRQDTRPNTPMISTDVGAFIGR